MYLRSCFKDYNGKRHIYWALVESYRTERGPRQRTVAYVGGLDAEGRAGVEVAAVGGATGHQPALFDEVAPRWVEVDLNGVRVERTRDFGGPWLGLQLLERLGLTRFFGSALPKGNEEIPWGTMAVVLVLCRLCHPSSELNIAEQFYRSTAMNELLGVPEGKVNDDRLYRSLDWLLPHKEALERYLKDRLGDLFKLEYDLALYDITSTYFEGQAEGNQQAKRGHSRDHRTDCKQVVIALVVSREGMPLGYEVFAGNRSDGATVKEIVLEIERRYGKARRIWVMDRGMGSAKNIAFLKEGKRQYILGTPRGQLRQFAEQVKEGKGWREIREGLKVKLCPTKDGEEVFILCHSAQRQEKEKAMREQFAQRIEEGLAKIAKGCSKQKFQLAVIERRVGRLLGRNTRAAGLFKVAVTEKEGAGAQIHWEKVEGRRELAELSEGCYLLRSSLTDWEAKDLWEAYIQLTEAETAFRIHKTELKLRPIWHHKKARVQAHILVCFLAYVLWKTLAALCNRAGLGDSPRKVFDEIARIQMVDVVLPTRSGIEIRKRCIGKPEAHQAILLRQLGLTLPKSLEIHKM